MDERLGRVLGGEDLRWLRQRVRERMADGQDLEVTVGLRDPSVDQRIAIGRLLARSVPGGRVLRVPLPSVSAALRDAGLATDVGAAVVELDGPVADRAGARAAASAAWGRVSSALEDAAERRPALGPWVTDLLRTGQVRRAAGGDPTVGEQLVRAALAVADRLPAPDVPLAQLARTALRDAHALDPDRPVGRLALGAAEALAGPPSAEGAEARRETWAAVGVLVDDLTTQVLVLGLGGGTATATDRLLSAAHEAGEPVPLTLGQLVRHPPDLGRFAGRVVRVVENVTVVGAAAAAHRAASLPLVSTRGQPTVAVLRLLEALSGAGARLAYQGDFDWPGLGIANRLLARTGATAWHYDTPTYVAAAARGGERLRGAPVEASWDPALGAALAELDVQVEQEDLLDLLLADLAP